MITRSITGKYINSCSKKYRSKLITKAIGSIHHCIIHGVCIVKRRTSKHKHTDALLNVYDDCGLNNCCLIKCNKQQEKYCVSRAKICMSGDIELNPGPVNGYLLLQSRLAQCGLSILDAGGAGDCFLEQYLINCMVNLAII